MEQEEKKARLLVKIKEERKSFFNRGHNVDEHDVAIDYLETGALPADFEDYELLEAIISDFDCVCSDYEIEKP